MFFAPAGEYRPQVRNYAAQLDSKTSAVPLEYDTKSFRPAYFSADFLFTPGKAEGLVLETGDNAPRLVYEEGGIGAELPFYSPAKGSGIIKTPACAVVRGKRHSVRFYVGLRDFSLEVDGRACAAARVDFMELPVSSLSAAPGCSEVKTQLGVFRRAGLAAKLAYFARPLLWLFVFGALAGLIISSGLGVAAQTVAWGGYALLFFWGISSDFSFLLPVLQGTYYDLTQAFLHRQLSLLHVPPPEMLVLPDPYDFSTVGQFKAWDLSLYSGKFFLYFGPVPALMRLLSFGLAGQAAAIVFYVAACVFLFCLTLWTAREKFFPKAGRGVLALLFASAAFSPLAVYLSAAYSIHVEAVVASAAFALGGVYFFLRELGERRAIFAVLAGCCFACAVGARTSAVALLLPFALYYVFAVRENWRRTMAFVFPLALACVLLMLYNYLRFGNVLEFGVSYQLNSTRPYVEQGKFFSLAYLGGNLNRYLLQMPLLSHLPPFLLPARVEWELYRPVFSLFLLFPLSLLGVLVLPRWKVIAAQGRLFWLLCALGGLCALLFVGANVVNTTRYVSDFAWLFALCGGLACLSWAESSSRACRICMILLTLLLLCGLCVAFSLRVYNWLECSPGRVFDCLLLSF